MKGFEKVLENEEMRKFLNEQLKDVSSEFQINFKREVELEAHVTYITDEQSK